MPTNGFALVWVLAVREGGGQVNLLEFETMGSAVHQVDLVFNPLLPIAYRQEYEDESGELLGRSQLLDWLPGDIRSRRELIVMRWRVPLPDKRPQLGCRQGTLLTFARRVCGGSPRHGRELSERCHELRTQSRHQRFWLRGQNLC